MDRDIELNRFSTGKKGNGNKKKGKTSRKKKVVIILSVICIILAALLAGSAIYINSILNTAKKKKIDKKDLGIKKDEYEDETVENIALFGIDSRKNTYKGLCDCNIILTIDRKHKSLKLTSIARDTYVEIDGHKKDKLTHAYAYGGAQLSIKTLNSNFALDIENYVTVNFFGIADIVDQMGGVMIDVSSAEMQVMNQCYVPELNQIGIKCSRVTQPGYQLLDGPQALCYARNRYTGGDVERGNRQKEVIMAVYEKAKDVSATQYPGLIKMFLKNCETSFTNSDLLRLATWGGLHKPEMKTLSLPDDECNPKSGADAFINGVWYYLYDIDVATRKIHDFIEEPEPDVPVVSEGASATDSTSSSAESKTKSSSDTKSKKSKSSKGKGK